MGVRVIVSCSGKFHAFNVAEQLHQRGALHRFYTSYAYQKNPFWRKLAKRVDLENIPAKKIRTFILWAIGRKLLDIPWLWNDIFDRWVALCLRFQKDYDVFVGWAGMSLHSMKVAQRMGKKTILIRSSAHIEFQNQLLQDEFARINQIFNIPKAEINKELLEYVVTDYVNVPSFFAYDSFIRKEMNKNKLFINSLGVDLNRFKKSTPDCAEEKEMKILFLGSLSLRKGIIDLFETIQILDQKGLKPQFLLVGGITLEANLFLSKIELPDNCNFLGHIPQQELNKVISGCSLGIIPSIEDGFAQVIPQLMASGIPVITTTNTGGPEMIQNGYNGYIVPIHSPGTIANLVAHMMNNPTELAQMSKNTRPSVSKGFSWNDYGERDYAFILEIMGLKNDSN